MADPIIVTGFLELDPANTDAAQAAMKALMGPTRQEDGNEGYAFSADLEQLGKYWIYEKWRDQASIDAHMASPHMADFFTAAAGLGITATEVIKWDGGTPTKLM